MSGMINSFYYGKAGQADYTPDQMPTSRVSLFFDMLRIHFSGLFSINLLYILFCLPAIAWTLLNFAVLTDAGTTEAVVGLIPTYLMIMIPCLGLCGVAAPGLMYVLRNWSRDQHSFMFSDFKEQIKGNWKNGLIVGLLNGFVTLTAYVGYMFYGQQMASSVFFIVPQMLVIMLCIFWWMMNMVIYTMMVTYDMKFGQLVRNSAIIVLARLPWALLIFGGSVLPAFIVLFVFPHIYAYLALGLIYLLVGFAITGMVYASFANSCFDKYLNPKIEGAQVGIGLRDPNYEDDLDDIDDPNPVDK